MHRQAAVLARLCVSIANGGRSTAGTLQTQDPAAACCFKETDVRLATPAVCLPSTTEGTALSSPATPFFEEARGTREEAEVELSQSQGLQTVQHLRPTACQVPPEEWTLQEALQLCTTAWTPCNRGSLEATAAQVHHTECAAQHNCTPKRSSCTVCAHRNVCQVLLHTLQAPLDHVCTHREP
jgi:hypothetical protein